MKKRILSVLLSVMMLMSALTFVSNAAPSSSDLQYWLNLSSNVNSATIYVPYSITVSENTTIPAGKTVYVYGSVTVANGKTLTNNGMLTTAGVVSGGNYTGNGTYVPNNYTLYNGYYNGTTNPNYNYNYNPSAPYGTCAVCGSTITLCQQCGTWHCPNCGHIKYDNNYFYNTTYISGVGYVLNSGISNVYINGYSKAPNQNLWYLPSAVVTSNNGYYGDYTYINGVGYVANSGISYTEKTGYTKAPYDNIWYLSGSIISGINNVYTGNVTYISGVGYVYSNYIASYQVNSSYVQAPYSNNVWYLPSAVVTNYNNNNIYNNIYTYVSGYGYIPNQYVSTTYISGYTKINNNLYILASMAVPYPYGAINTPQCEAPEANVSDNASLKVGDVVTLKTETTGAVIYYTTNGKTPNTSSMIYSGGITVSDNMTIKAIAVKNGFTVSPTTTIKVTAAKVSFTDISGYPGLSEALVNLVKRGVFTDSTKFDTEGSFSYTELMNAFAALKIDTSDITIDTTSLDNADALSYNDFAYITYRVLRANNLVTVPRTGSKTINQMRNSDSIKNGSMYKAAFVSMIENDLFYDLYFNPSNTATRMYFATTMYYISNIAD